MTRLVFGTGRANFGGGLATFGPDVVVQIGGVSGLNTISERITLNTIDPENAIIPLDTAQQPET